MVLEDESIIRGDSRANTMYISIPAKIVSDSGFKFVEGDKVTVTVTRDKKEMYIKAIE